jgi:hypothetical protein
LIPLTLLAADAGPSSPFKEGDLITFEDVDKLKDYLPEELWRNREFFFHEGMKIKIGPTQRKYEGNEQYEAATRRFQGQTRLGRDGSLQNHIAGRPFATESIDCRADPDAGTKIIWNFARPWGGDGARVTWSYT